MDKSCTKCGETKTANCFSKDKKTKDGLQVWCKDCYSSYKKHHSAANREKKAEYQRQYRRDNPEKLEEYRHSHKEQLSEYQRQYYIDNKEHITNSVKNYVQQNREWFDAYHKRYKQENKEQYNAYNAKRRVSKRGTLTDYDLELSVEYRKAIANDPCFYCGTTDALTYHVDHFFPIAKGGDDGWSNLVRACSTCNLSKNDKCGTYTLLKEGK